METNESIKEVATKEGLFRASQHNFNQAEAGYNAKWFKRGAVFGAKWQSEKSDEYTISFTEWVIEKELFYSLQCCRIKISDLLLMFKKEKGL